MLIYEFTILQDDYFYSANASARKALAWSMAMKSALAIVAFAQGSESKGVLALLETALSSLDRTGDTLAAVYVDKAMSLLCARIEEEDVAAFIGLAAHG